jgi:hypothetical protein
MTTGGESMLYEAERGDICIAVAGDAMIARRMCVFGARFPRGEFCARPM